MTGFDNYTADRYKPNIVSFRIACPERVYPEIFRRVEGLTDIFEVNLHKSALIILINLIDLNNFRNWEI